MVQYSTKTKQSDIADRIADELSAIIQNPARWNDVGDVLPRTKEIWRPIETETAETAELLKKVSGASLMFGDNLLDPEFQKQYIDPTLFTKENVDALDAKFTELLDKLKIVTLERDQYKQLIVIYEADRRARGAKAIKDATPVPLNKAIDAFFEEDISKSTNAAWLYILRKWFERFAGDVGKETPVLEITPEQVIKHIQNQKIKHSRKQSAVHPVAQAVKDETKKRLTFNLCKLLMFATKGQFDEKAVKTAILPRLADENHDWFWLNRKQALALIKKLEGLANGQYWADAAMLQYACGLRPEELPLLQTAKAHSSAKDARITIDRIFDGNTLIRRVKTKKSVDVVQVPGMALKALKRRVAEKNFLLFPLYDDSLIAPRFRTARTSFEISNKLWPSAEEHEFSAVYIGLLREAAAKVRGLDPKKIDGRIFRRTCARELILKHGYERAAAVIRDNVDTLRGHYADLRAADTSTER
jgi:hypothetical protein